MNQSGVTSYDQVGAIDNFISFWDALDIIIICKFCCPTYENAHVKVQENEFSVGGSLEIGASLVSFSMFYNLQYSDLIIVKSNASQKDGKSLVQSKPEAKRRLLAKIRKVSVDLHLFEMR